MRTPRPLLWSALLLVSGSLASGSALAQAERLSVAAWGSFVSTVGDTAVDPAFGVRIRFADGWGAGAGVGYRFAGFLSAELSASHLENRGEIDIAGTKVADLGRLRMTPVALVLRLHPIAEGPVDPWVGLGGAWVFFGDLTSDDLTTLGTGKVEVKDRGALAFDAGVGFQLAPRFTFFVDGRYLALKPTSRGGTGPDQELKVNPLAVSAGFRVGF